MRYLVIGKGHLGTIIARSLRLSGTVKWWQKDIADLTSIEMIEFDPDVVVNAAGKTDLGWCEKNQTECWRCNVVEPLKLQRRLPLSAQFVHISSGCIWDGPLNSNGQPFTKYDPPTPAAFYSWSKAAADALLKNEAALANKKLLIIRPRQVFSESNSPRNTITKLMTYPKLIDTPNSMTSAGEICETIKLYCEKNANDYRQEVMLVYNPGTTSPYKVGMALYEAGLRGKPEKMNKDDLDKNLIPKRVDTIMKDDDFERLVHPSRIDEAIRVTIRDIKILSGSGHTAGQQVNQDNDKDNHKGNDHEQVKS